MAANLLKLLENEFSDDAIAKIASFVGETPAHTQAAIGQAVPATVAALAQKSQTTQGAADLYGTLQRSGFDGTFGSLGTLLKAGAGGSDLVKTGGPLASNIFGAQRTGVTDAIAAATGIRAQSAGSLLAIAVPVVLNLVGREAATAGGFNAASVATLLGGQWGFLQHVLPAGLASVLGWTRVAEPVRAYETPRAEPARAYTAPVHPDARAYDRGSSLGWLKWAIPLLLLVPILYWAFGLRNHEPTRNLEAVGPAVGTAGTRLIKQHLGCGRDLDVAPNGVESGLVAFIDNPSFPADRETWFTFDRLEFETGSATLTPGSQPQLRNIVEILRCYPNVTVKFGGYTDNVGDPASNQQLSQLRADNARQAVIAQGIDASRVEAQGYGQDHPVASNDTAEGRQRNRRIDIRVTKK